MSSLAETTGCSAGVASSSLLVKKAVGGWLARHVTLMATGIFPKNDKDSNNDHKSNPLTRFLKTNKKLQNTDVKKATKKLLDKTSKSISKQVGTSTTAAATATSTTIETSTTTIIAASIGTLFGTVYILYPTSLLLLFRISEQISWIHLFEHYHSCRMGSYINCFQLGLIQVSQLGIGFGSILYFYYLIWIQKGGIKTFFKGVGVYFLLWCFGIAIMRYSVDGIGLYQPPDVEKGAIANWMHGKVAVITGANRGIGLATATWLASQGAHVVVTCRSIAKCQPVADQINEQQKETKSAGSASAAVLDLSSLQSANDLVVQLKKEFPNGIHYLFCNAGTTPQFPLTQDGLEDGFGGMHLAHMAVALGILPLLKKGAEQQQEDSRIVTVSSEMSINAAMGIFGSLDDMFDISNIRGERIRGDGTLTASMPAYGRAKLCNVLFALELNRRMKACDCPVVANAVHTGAVVTDSSRNSIRKTFDGIFPGLPWLVGNVYFPLLWRNVEGGARTLLCAALSEKEFVVKGGQYLDALCHAFLPKNMTEKDLSNENIIPIPIGKGKTLKVFLDPVQALLVADAKHSKWLWNVSMELLMKSPAAEAVDFSGILKPGQAEAS